MTYTILTTILILALIAVVVTVVSMTDEDEAGETFSVSVPTTPPADAMQQPDLSSIPIRENQPEEQRASDRAIVGVSEEADRDAGPIGI